MTDTDAHRLARIAKLRDPFPDGSIGRLPKPTRKDAAKGKCGECGGWHGLPAVHLDYVGHAALTSRLLDVDPEWSWEPVAFDECGLPRFDENGGLWIRLTVCGVTRLGYGDAEGKRGSQAVKEAIGDALRNAGMRFGAALDLWHKGELRPAPEPSEADKARDELRALLRDRGIDAREYTDRVWTEKQVDIKEEEDPEVIRVLILELAGDEPAPASSGVE